jgi:hypothetical protein
VTEAVYQALIEERDRSARLRWWVVALATALVCSTIAFTIQSYRALAESRANCAERSP